MQKVTPFNQIQHVHDNNPPFETKILPIPQTNHNLPYQKIYSISYGNWRYWEIKRTDLRIEGEAEA